MVTVSGYTGTYNATAHGATGTVVGVAGDLAAAGSSLNLGSSFINAPGGTASWTFTGGINYNNQNGTAAIVIGKANSSVSVTGGTFYYDGTSKAATGSVSGVGGVILTPVTFNYKGTFSTVYGPTATAPTQLGTYEVTASFAGNSNYNSSSNTASMSIICSDAAILPTVTQWDFATAVGGGSVIPVINTPLGIKNGDLLIVGLMYEKGTATSVTPPKDWVEIRRTNQGNNIGMGTYYKKVIDAKAEPSSYSFVLTNSPKWSIGISRVEGADLSGNPIAAVGGDSGNQSFTAVAPSIVTGGTSCNNLVMAFFTNKKDATWIAPTGTTEVYDNPNNQQGLTSNMMAYYVQALGGATGTKTATASLRDYWVAQQIAIKGVKSGSSSREGIASTTTSDDQLFAEQSGGASVTAYPNPVVDWLSIQFPEFTKEPAASSINIFDQVGRSYPINAVWHAENTSLQIDFAAMNKGLYFIRIGTENTVQTLKVIKQ